MISNEEDFTSLEMQLIRSSLSTRTDEEIAEILERPIEKIRQVINDITGMAGQRQQEIKDQRIREMQAESVKRRQRILKAEDRQEKLEKEEKKKIREEKKQKERNHEHRAQLKRQETKVNRMYKSRNIDYSKLKALKIDEKTFVFLEPGDDPEEVRKKYLQIRKQQSNGTHALES